MKRFIACLVFLALSAACAAQTLTTANTGIRAEGSGRSGPLQAATEEALPTFDGEGLWAWNMETHSLWCYDGSTWVDYGPEASGAVMPDGTVPFTAPQQVAGYAYISLPTPASGSGWVAYDSTHGTLAVWDTDAWHFLAREGSNINFGDITATSLVLGGTVTAYNILPATTDLYTLGSATKRWTSIYALEILCPVSVGATLYFGDSGEGQRLSFVPTTGVFQRDGHTVWDAGNITPPAVSTGTTAPSSTPGKPGDIFVNTSGAVVYIATGSSSSSDWKCVTNCP